MVDVAELRVVVAALALASSAKAISWQPVCEQTEEPASLQIDTKHSHLLKLLQCASSGGVVVNARILVRALFWRAAAALLTAAR
jgi:hypothetical protein